MSGRPVLRYAVSAATALALAWGLAAIPRDECGASTSGACVDLGRNPFATHTVVGEAGDVDLGSITVTEVRAAETVRARADDEAVAAPAGGRWVILDVTATVKDKPRRVSASLVAGQRTWLPEDRPMIPQLQPGLPGSGQLVFLVPDTVTSGDLTAYLRFGSGTAVAVPLREVATEPSVDLGRAGR